MGRRAPPWRDAELNGDSPGTEALPLAGGPGEHGQVARTLVRFAPLLTLLLALSLAGCAARGRGAAGVPARLYVANARDGTVSQLDAGSGRAIGPPIPAGTAPAQVVASASGGLLVVPAAVPADGALVHLSRSGTGWVQRPVALEPGASGVLAAGDGGRRAAVAYHVPEPGQSPSQRRCRLAVVDLDAGAVEHRHGPCGAGEHAVSLALDAGPAGPVAYLGLVREAAGAAGPPGPGAGRVLAVDAGGAPVSRPPAGRTAGGPHAGTGPGAAGPAAVRRRGRGRRRARARRAGPVAAARAGRLDAGRGAGVSARARAALADGHR